MTTKTAARISDDGKKNAENGRHSPNPVFENSPTFQMACRQLNTVAEAIDLDPGVLERLSQENPTEMIDTYGLHEGELSMFVGYGGLDQFNIDAQVASFLAFAKQRGLCVAVAYEPRGRHDEATVLKLVPKLIDWLAPQIAPFSPPCCTDPPPELGK